MVIEAKEYCVNGLNYVIRSALPGDAKQLSAVRVQIDGETENMDREQGEAVIDEDGFLRLIQSDADKLTNLFLVAEVNDRIAGFSRCEGSSLKRLRHKVEFGICVRKEYWGYGMGKNLLSRSTDWADANQIKRMVLFVLEANQKAIALYKRFGFEVEGTLRNDKLLSDGKYYNTIVMGRLS